MSKRPLKIGSSKRSRVIASALEGPYESGAEGNSVGLLPREAENFLLLVDFLQQESEMALGASASVREMRMLVFLIHNHSAGRLVTSSSLATASALTYGTAMRAIEKMILCGIILKRPRTATGKSFSLHPSEDLLARWHRFAWRGNEFVRQTFDFGSTGTDPGRKSKAMRLKDDTGYVLPPPAVLTNKLHLRQGLRVLVHADPTFMAMQSFKRQQEMMLGIPIASRALSIDRLHEEVVANSSLAVSKYDIIACDFPWFGEMASSGRLLPLDGLLREIGSDALDFYPESLASSRWNGSQYGIPAMMTGEFLIYRKDILDEAGLAPPQTIAETVEIVRKLDGRYPNVSGIAWNGKNGTPLGHTFLMVMAAFGQSILDLNRNASGFDAENVKGEQLRPMFLSLEARQTSEYLLEILPYSVPDVLDMAWYDRALAFKSGRCALAYSHTMLAPLFETDPQSPAFQRTGYLPHPFGPRGKPIVPMGGYGLAIPSNLAKDRVEPVTLAMKAMTSANAAKIYLTNGSLASPRRSVSLDPQVRSLSQVVSIVHEMAEAGVVRMWPRPPVPEISDIIRFAGEEIHALLLGEKSIGNALRDAQNRSDALMRSHGHY